MTARICSACSCGRALDVDAVDRRDREVDRELDRVVGPRQLLLALHLLGELRHPPLQLVRVAEESAEAFHAGDRRARGYADRMPTVEGAGVPLHYVERGHGPPVLLVHGLASDAEALAPVAAAVAAGGARAIAYDRRGYGAQRGARAVRRDDGRGAGRGRRRAPARARTPRPPSSPATASARSSRSTSSSATAASSAPPCSPTRSCSRSCPRRPSSCPRSARRSRRPCGPEARERAWRRSLGDRAEGAALERARAAHRGFFADYAGIATWSVTPPRAARDGDPGGRRHRPADAAAHRRCGRRAHRAAAVGRARPGRSTWPRPSPALLPLTRAVSRRDRGSRTSAARRA